MAISRPSFNTPWCTWPMDAAANGLSSNDDSFSRQPGPSSSSRTFYTTRSPQNALKTCYLTFKNQHFPLKLLLKVHKMTTLTFICQVGMKSALCRTLSKIFCSWGLMKELSEKRKEILWLWRYLDTILLFVLLLQCVPWMLSICPILSAAPRTLQSVLTILSALASDRRGESNRALVSTKQTAQYD